MGEQFEFVVHPCGTGTVCYNRVIIPKGINKANRIVLICRYYGADLNYVIAFGGSMNDATMLKRAGLAVAMGNAYDELKGLADIVCEDVARDGVLLAVKRMGLCE